MPNAPLVGTNDPVIRCKKTSLTIAISMALTLPAAQAATFNVTEPLDDGSGLVANTLSWAILQANTTAGDDVIELNTDVTITGVMKRLIDSNTTLQSDATRRSIDGNNQFRPLFIKSGQVTIQDLDVQNGLAEGGNSNRGGRGAGMGGALFMYDGSVFLSGVNILNSSAIGGDGTFSSNGGGGMYGQSSRAGGGLFENSQTDTGAYGGYGSYQNIDNQFAQGGFFIDFNTFNDSGHGGFGAGGGYGYYGRAGDGGFGGGGGYGYYNNGGDGGFGAGGGQSFYGLDGDAGFAANRRIAAGLGGGLFIRTGLLELNDLSIENSVANSGGTTPNNSEGYGGAIFVLHTTTNSNGNNQGMPQTLPTVSGCGVVFNNNQADTDPGLSNNNNDVFDLASRITPSNGIAITEPCGIPDQEIQITGNGSEILDGDNTPDNSDGSNFGAVVALSGSISQEFSINNLGNFSLQLTGDPLVELVNNDNNQFSITQFPIATIVGNQSSNFEVTFAPSNMIGIDTATVVIANNDPDENPYEFVIQAEVLPAPPEISVEGNGFVIEDGDVTPDAGDFTAMGQAQESAQSITQTFIIGNDGAGDLLLSGMPIVELQNNNGQFTISTQPTSSTLSTNEQVSFDVTFTPTSVGIDSATVVIQNNDADENPYDFVIEAEGLAQAPVLQVLGNGIEIEFGDESPEPIDNTDFGFTPVTGGMVVKTFEIKNIGFAPLNLNNIQLFQFNADFTITQNITDTTLENGESTFVTVQLNPTSAGFSDFTAFEVYDENFNFLHYHVISGYGQPSLLINASNNYLQEGELAEFTVFTDVNIDEFYEFNWQVNGQVDGQDFGGVLPSGSGFLDNFSNQFTIQFTPIQDGVYEGPELFNVQLSTVDPRLALGFPSVSGGVIDDDLIYVDGFDGLSLNQVIASISKYALDTDQPPVCDNYGCHFLNRAMTLTTDSSQHGMQALVWFEETLVMLQPTGDWDGDGLANTDDLNPFGLAYNLLSKINTKQ